MPSPDRPGRRPDARVKLIAAVGFVVAVVVAPPGSWRYLGALGLGLGGVVVASGVSIPRLFARWLGFLLLVGFLAALAAGRVAATSGLSWRMAALDLVARNGLALLAMMTLAQVTPWTEMLRAMRRLGMPPALASTLAFMHRYGFVLRDELARMATARRARSFGRRGPGFAALASLIGVLLGRALDREERVFAAMTARGWDGTLRTLDD
ncbi:energy-coupling factor transporter transmembrane component T [Paludisphaera sp.]|uniref:energy-coupling factor transporter transmembrane component T n=1 Tax=Paludisphaera sp. TaxID=2017432 RepID=UPI00301D2772